MEFACTTCKSDNIQRLAVVYEGGLSNIRTQSTGVGVGMGRGGLGSALMSTSTRGTAQTEASKRAAPPRKKPVFGPLLALFLLFVALKSFRFLFWGPRWGWGHHHGHWGERGVPPMFDEWHKQAHGESTEEKKE